MTSPVTFLDSSDLGLIVGTAFTTIVAAYLTLRLVDRITIGKRKTRMIWLGAGVAATAVCAVYCVHMAAMQFMPDEITATEFSYLTFPSNLASALPIVLAALSVTVILISITNWRRTPLIQDFAQDPRQLRSIFDQVSDGVAIFDMRRNVLFSNNASSELLGSLDDCAIAGVFEAAFEFSLPNGRTLVREEWPIALALRGEFFQNVEVMIRHRDSGKTLRADLSTAPIKNKKDQTVQIISIFRDLSQPQLDLGAIAHDFNSLLSVIAGNLSLVERWVAGNTPALKHLEIAGLATMRSTDLMGRLLAFPSDHESQNSAAVSAFRPRQLQSGPSVNAIQEIVGDRTSVEIPGVEETVTDTARVYEFAKLSDSAERLERGPDSGVTVALPFPLASVAAQAEVKSVSMQSSKVLVVDDEPDILEVAVAHLENMGYTALPATGGANALEIAGQNADIALVVTDVIMPGSMDGVELVQKIRHLLPSVKVIYSSGFSADALADRNRTFVDGLLLQKPYLRAEFHAVIRNAMEKTKSSTVNVNY
jgi:CheY-like chemotaxis protein/PAS domain-containing protein